MQLGATIPVADIGTGPAEIRDYAQTVEGLGLTICKRPTTCWVPTRQRPPARAG